MRLWIDAKTCSKRVGRAPPTHFSPNDAVAQRVAERGEALVEDLLAVGDEQQADRGSSLTQTRVVDRRHDGLARAGGGDEQVAVVAALRATARSARAGAPGTVEAQLDRAEDDERARCRCGRLVSLSSSNSVGS